MAENDYEKILTDKITFYSSEAKRIYIEISSPETIPLIREKLTDQLNRVLNDLIFFEKQKDRTVDFKVISEIDFYPPMREEKIQKEKEFHNKRLLSLTRLINLITEIINELSKNPLFENIINQLSRERFNISLELEEEKMKIKQLNISPDLTDEEIDIYLRRTLGTLEFKGEIFIHNTATEVGEIEYRGNNNRSWLGDIGYSIRVSKRGNNYAYKALKLIAPLILAEGSETLTITTEENNIASQKTIEKFGGIRTDNYPYDIICYKCNLRDIVKKQEESKSAIKR